MSEPRKLITDEMLSAYVDDELSDDERRRVEQIVAQDPRYAQLLQQLQSLREALRDLPAERPDDEFSRRVLQRIATVRFENDAPPAGQDAIASAAQRPAADHPPARDWGRPLIWSALAVAAALLVMVLAPDARHAPRNVATAPERARQLERAVERESAAGADAERPALYDTDDSSNGPTLRQLNEQRDFVDDRLRSRKQAPRSATEENEVLGESLERAEQLDQPQSRRPPTEELLDFRSGITGDQVIADADRAEAPPPDVVVQADTTTAQLSDLLARLRQDQIPVSALDNPSVDMLATEGRVRAEEAVRLTDTTRRARAESTPPAVPTLEADGPESPSANRVRLYVLEASPDQVRESLARANVRGELVDANQLGRLSMYFAVDPKSSDEVEGRLPHQAIPAAPSAASAEHTAPSSIAPDESAPAAASREPAATSPSAVQEADQRRGLGVAAGGPAERSANRHGVDQAPAAEAEHRLTDRDDAAGTVAGGTVGQAGQRSQATEPAAVPLEPDSGVSTQGPGRAGLAGRPNVANSSSADRPTRPTAQRVLLLLKIVDPPARPAAAAEPDR